MYKSVIVLLLFVVFYLANTAGNPLHPSVQEALDDLKKQIDAMTKIMN